MSRKVLIIQARMGSARLPKKTILELAGKPLVVRILERVKRVKNIDEIVLATSVLPQDDVLEDLAKSNNVKSFRGSHEDLVDRYYCAAKFFNAKTILRLPADNPFPEPSEYDRLMKYFQSSGKDFVSNILPFMQNGYANGIGVEIFTFDSLKYIWKNEKNPFKREHVALNYYDYINDKKPPNSHFSIGTIKCPKKFSRPDIRLSVDTYEEYLKAKRIYDDLYFKDKNFSFTDVIKWIDKSK